MSPTLHCIHGYLASGKTTFSKQLEQKHKAVRLSTDSWMVKLYGPSPTAAEFEKENHITVLQHQLAARLLTLGLDVILDHGFWSRNARDQARALAEHCKAEFKLYSLKASFDVLKARALKRSQNLDHETFFIDENAFEVLKERFEALGEDEIHIAVDPDFLKNRL